MTDMVEKVARAIDPSAFEQPNDGWLAMQPKGQSREVALKEWDSRKRGPRAKARIRARAAIHALIEPTLEMGIAGSGALGEKKLPVTVTAANECWQAMLKVALDD